MSTWYLNDVVAAARRKPDTFFIPCEAERRSCREGDLLQLHFVLSDPSENEPRAERMWVEVSERFEQGASIRYRGILTNEPVYIQSLKPGDLIEFQPTHIAQTTVSASHPDYLPIGEMKALVSAFVLEEGRKACWAYREPADRPEDSGWRLFRGDESDEYVDDAANIRICNVYWLANRDPTLQQIFRAEVGSAFERSGESDDWERVADWTPEDD